MLSFCYRIAYSSICPEWTVAYASPRRYRMPVVKRTSLNLDFDLLGKAREVLGSNGTTDTVHRALEEVVRQEKLRELRATRTW